MRHVEAKEGNKYSPLRLSANHLELGWNHDLSEVYGSFVVDFN